VASLAQIRTALRDTVVAAIPALTGYDTIPGSPNLPAFAVIPVEADFTVAMGRGVDTWQLDVFVLVSSSDEGLGQTQLDLFVSGAGSSSVRQAVFAARGLGLTDTDAHIAAMTGYNLAFSAAQVDHIGATLRAVVHTSGTG
jgi:hypothetical protein